MKNNKKLDPVTGIIIFVTFFGFIVVATMTSIFGDPIFIVGLVPVVMSVVILTFILNIIRAAKNSKKTLDQNKENIENFTSNFNQNIIDEKDCKTSGVTIDHNHNYMNDDSKDRCPHCHEEIEQGMYFCNNCGTKVYDLCLNCRSKIRVTDERCPKCKTKNKK